MSRTGTILVTAVLVLVLVVTTTAIGVTGGSPTLATGGDGPPAITGNAIDDDTPATGTATRTGTVKPGAQFVGVVGAHGAHHAGEIEEAAVDIRLSEAGSPGARAEVVADVLTRGENRTDSLAERKADLAGARENGTMNESEYRTRVAVVDAELRAIERVAGKLEDATGELPTTVLLDVDIDVGAVVDLKTRASELQGPELERIAPSFRGSEDDTAGSTVNATRTPTP